MTIMSWNGDDLPDELRELPAGRYVVTPVDEVRDLSAEEDEGLGQVDCRHQLANGEIYLGRP